LAYEQTARGLGGQDHLLHAVRDLVRQLKKNGESPERVLITIKALCGRPAAPFAKHYDPFANGSAARPISEIVIGVAIEEYFSGPIVDGSGSV
jgi:hypothetical protein